jgi:hypothetical protein
MYASCGWFFDDIAGLEGSLVIRMAAHALDLLGQAGGEPPTADVLALLAEGKSNRADEGTGADVFRRVLGDRVTPARAMGRAALGALVTGGAPEAPGYDVALATTDHARTAGTLAGRARARHRRTGRVDEAAVAARAGRRATFEVTVGAERMTLAELGDDARGAIVMEALPALVPEARDLDVARLIRVAARDVPPDRDTPAGVARRALLTRVIAGLLAPEAGPLSDDAVHVAADLVEAADLPPGGPDRREIEELVWDRLREGPPSPALRGLAGKLGFAAAALASPQDDAPLVIESS